MLRIAAPATRSFSRTLVLCPNLRPVKGDDMNKLGVHALVWEGGWSHEEAARAIGRTAELGFDLIEIPALDPSSIDVEFTRREIERAGIGVTLSLGLDAQTDI